MSADILLGFGDSWTRGADIDRQHEKTYLTLLAEHFGIESINCSYGGSSIPHLVLQLNRFIESQYFSSNRYHAVFFLTAQERTIVYDNDQTIHISPGGGDSKDLDGKRGEFYYKHTYNHQLGTFKLNVTVLALQQICLTYGIKDYYLAGWQEIELWQVINRTKFFADGKPITTLFTTDNSFRLFQLLKDDGNPYLTHAHGHSGHPNQQGHAKIAQALANWIKI